MKLRNVLPIARAYLISIAIWCVLSLLTGWQYRIFDQGLNIHSSLLDMILLAESRGFALALLTPPIFYFVRRQIGSAKPSPWYLFAYALGLGPFMLLYACIRWIVLPPWDAVLQMYVPRTAHGPLELIRTGFADQITMYIAIVVAAHASEYFERVRKQELERYEYQRALAASELQALRIQLHPHFLFNTLHGISTLIDNAPQSAKAMVIKLSSLLRTALQHSGSDLIPLRDELAFIGEYLDLEEMRFGARLKVVWSIAPDTPQILVPQLILQPLVENAIRHGIACTREGGWVEVGSRRTGETCELQVRNSFRGNLHKGTGLGLRNTEARLRHLYSHEATLCFKIGDDQTATTTLRFPALGSQQPLGEPKISVDAIAGSPAEVPKRAGVAPSN
jgi:two-component system LytT family sensor kinase